MKFISTVVFLMSFVIASSAQARPMSPSDYENYGGLQGFCLAAIDKKVDVFFKPFANSCYTSDRYTQRLIQLMGYKKNASAENLNLALKISMQLSQDNRHDVAAKAFHIYEFKMQNSDSYSVDGFDQALEIAKSDPYLRGRALFLAKDIKMTFQAQDVWIKHFPNHYNKLSRYQESLSDSVCNVAASKVGQSSAKVFAKSNSVYTPKHSMPSKCVFNAGDAVASR